jgi:hypothetical protein
MLHYFSVNGLRRFLKIRKEIISIRGLMPVRHRVINKRKRAVLPLLTTTIDFWNLRILVRQVKSDDVPKSSLT